MERFIPPRDSYYNPENPVDSDDELEPLGGWNPENPPLHAEQEPREPIPAPTYTEADLYPTTTTPDPQCDPEWPLACYWPVYVSNFRLDDLAEEARNGQVGKFFAANGLLARMIFVWEPERNGFYYSKFQQAAMLFDMLVYFTSEEDAGRAMRLCHRLTYYGHRLNVWPGRSPVWFDNSRSIRFKLTTNFCAEKSETAIELILRKHHGPCIETVARFSVGDVVVEFSTVESMRAAVLYTKHWVPQQLLEPTRKQRYLEQDVEAELLKTMADKAGFLDMVPPKEVLQQLLAGRIPDVDRSWENVAKPREIPASTKEKYEFVKNKRKQHLLRNGQRRRQGGGNALLDGAPPVKKPLSIRAKRAMVREEADRILGKGSSSADRFKFSMLNKKKKYEKIKPLLLATFKNRVNRRTPKELKELFYNMLALEEELMDLLPQCGDIFESLQLGIGLSKAVLIAGYDLPFPVCPPPEIAEEFYQDLPPPCDDMPTVPSSIPTVRPYSPTDLTPTILDPSCDPTWPLANLWPVYVDNFRLNTLNVPRRNEQIHNYFAAKGLLATRIFIHDNPPSFQYLGYQKRLMLLDMLVYFTSQEDAQKAIQLCHRESYYGHYLNVFPGREALFYDFNRSGYCRVQNLPSSKILAQHPKVLSATYVEENILEVLPQDVSCVTRHERNIANFEFNNPDLLKTVIPRLAAEITRRSGIQNRPKQKQRYLECDMMEPIKEKLLVDPAFMHAQPKPELLEALYAGSVSPGLINWNWFGWAGPRKPGMHLKLYESMTEFHMRITEVLEIWQQMQEMD